MWGRMTSVGQAVPPALRPFPNRRFLTAVKDLTDSMRLVFESTTMNSREFPQKNIRNARTPSDMIQ